MKLTISTVAGAGLIAPHVSAAAVPADYLPGIAPRGTECAQPNSTETILDSLSSLFGWQMAGAFLFPNLTSAACADISSLGNGKWAAMGLNPDSIQEPLCHWSKDTADPDPSNTITAIIRYTSQIFITQILGSFDDDALQYMCNQADFFLLDQMLLNDTAVIGGICHRVGNQLPPRPFGPNHPDSDGLKARTTIKNSATNLYALLLATGAITEIGLSALCEHAPEYAPNLNAELLNGDMFQDTICSVKDTVTVDVAVVGIRTLTTQIFVTMIQNLSNDDDWKSWLCGHIDKDALDCVNLDGEAVLSTICHESTTDIDS